MRGAPRWAAPYADGKCSRKSNAIHCPDIIVDGTLSNADRAHREIEASRASGRDVNVIYVYRSPEKSAQGAIDRAIDKGRPVPADVLAEAHANAPKTVKALAQIYDGNGRVTIEAIWNDGQIEEIRPLPIEEIPDVNRQQAEHTFQSAIESANTTGRLTPKLYAAFRRGNPSTEIGRKTQDREMDIDTGRNRRLEEENEQVHRRAEQTDSRNFTQDPITAPENDHAFRNAVESVNAAGEISPKLYDAFSGRNGIQSKDRHYPDSRSAAETLGKTVSRKNEGSGPQQYARHPITIQENDHAFQNAIESANAAGHLSPRLYEAFRGGDTTEAPGRTAPNRDMDHEAGRNRRPEEKNARLYREDETTRSQQYAQDPITTPENDITQEPAPAVMDAPIGPAPAVINTPPPPIPGPGTTAPPPAEPSQPAIDPQQQRQTMAAAFRQHPAQAVETFPELAPAHKAFQAVAKRAATMRNPQHRNQLLSLLQNKLAKRIEHGLSVPTPRRAVEWAANLVNGRGRGD